MVVTKGQRLRIVLIVAFLGEAAGAYTSMFMFKHHVEKEFEKYLSRGDPGAPFEIGDSTLWYVVIGTLIGIMIGLAVGISLSVWLKKKHSAPASSLV